MSASAWFVYIMADDRTKLGINQKYVQCKFKFSLFKSYEPKFNYDASGLHIYKIFKMHNKFFVGRKL